MSDLEQEARAKYRVVYEPTPRVLALHNGEWIVGYYCQTRAGANKCLERCVQKYVEWAGLSEDERTRRILR